MSTAYEDRLVSRLISKQKRKKKLEKYLKEKFKRHYATLTDSTIGEAHSHRSSSAAGQELNEESNDKFEQDYIAERVLQRLSSFQSSFYGRTSPLTTGSNDRDDPSSLSTPNLSRMSSMSRNPVQKSLSSQSNSSRIMSVNEKLTIQKSTSRLVLDKRQSIAFIEMNEDLQSIIAGYSSDAAVELAKLQLEQQERSNSLLSEDDIEFRANSVMKQSLDEMISRLPYGSYFRQFGVADVDEIRVRSDSNDAPAGNIFANSRQSTLSIERRIVDYNDLSVSDREISYMQMKLVIIGHPVSAKPELSALLTTAINMLADRCRTVGMSLVVFNSTWGVSNDSAAEEYAYSQLEALKEFLKPDGSLLVNLILMNDKFGHWLLPERVPSALFEEIFEKASAGHEKAMSQLATLNRQYKEHESVMKSSQPSPTSKKSGQSVQDTALEPLPGTPPSIQVTKADLTDVEKMEETAKPPGSKASNRELLSVEPTTPTSNSKFRKAVKNLRSQTLVLRSVLKDFDPINPVTMNRWYSKINYSTSNDYFLVKWRTRQRNEEDEMAKKENENMTASNPVEDRKQISTMFHKYGKRNPIFYQSAFGNEVRCVLQYGSHAPTFAAVRRFVDFSAKDREGAVDFANYHRRKNGILNHDSDADAEMAKLMKLVRSRISSDRLITSAVRWSPKGLDPSGSYEHFAYVEKIVMDAVNQATDVLSRFVAGLTLHRWSGSLSYVTQSSLAPPTPASGIRSAVKPPPELIEDIAFHLNALDKTLKPGQYHYSITDQVEECLSLVRSNQYTFVCGDASSGKSMLLGNVATTIRPKLRSKRCNPIVVYRQIGLTKRSINVRVLLCDLKKQIDHMYHAGMPPPPAHKLPFDTTYLGIENEFEKTLAIASANRPIFIVLDGILRLLDFYNGDNLKWLSQNRNPHVHYIFAIATHEDSLANAIKAAMTNKSIPIAIYEMKPLTIEIVRDYMSKQLAASGIRPSHFVDMYLADYNHANNGANFTSFLLIDLVCRKILTGNHDHRMLPTNLKTAINSLFVEAAAFLGDLVVSRALGYLATSRIGLTRLELCDLLTQDVLVSVHLRDTLKLPMFLTPPAIVSSLVDVHLKPILATRFCDGWPLITFRSKMTADITYERFVHAKDQTSLGREMTDYFLSNWSSQPRYVESIRRYERFYICSQQVMFTPEPKWRLAGSSERANMRRVDELPFAALHAGQKSVSADAVKGDCYINYDFLLAASRVRGLAYVLDMYHWVIDHLTEPDDELVVMYESLKLSRTVLQRDISQLGSQLAARLASLVAKDVPLAPGDPPKYLNIRNMLRAISVHRTHPSLVSSGSALMPPGKLAFYELNGGHRLPITAMAVSEDNALLLTSAMDNKMILWNLKLGGRIIKLLHHVGSEVRTLHFARNNELAIVVEKNRLSVWDLEKADILIVLFKDFLDPLKTTMLNNGMKLASCLNNSNVVTIWDMNSTCLGNISKTVDLSEWLEPHLKTPTSGMLFPCNGSPDSLLLCTARRTNFAIVWNCETNKLGQRLKIAHPYGFIHAIGRSAEVLAVAYMAYEENNRAVISIIDLFLASDKYQLIHSIHGCKYDEIDEIYVNATGSHAVAAFSNRKSNTSHLMVWNLETEDHKHICSHNGVTNRVAMATLNCMCTTDSQTSRILVWNLAFEVSKRVPKYKPKYYVSEIQRMQNYAQYAVTRTSNNGPITVWNCFLGRCAGKSVRIEHGITGEASDILLLRNTRLLVLTEVKTIIGNSAEVRTQIFSAFRLYDIYKRVLLRRVADCLVPMGSSEDFVYFDVSRFMGLSESRTEFIVWDVETGHQLMRVKPSFEPLLDLLDPTLSRIRGRRPSVMRISTAQRRFLDHLQSEHRNTIFEFLVSEDMSTIITSHYAHYLCVIVNRKSWFQHAQTIAEPDSLLLLTVSSLSADGQYLVTYTYDECKRMAYLTVWSTREAQRIRRMAGLLGVGAVCISKDGDLVCIGKEDGEFRVWNPKRHHSERIIKPYPGCSFQPGRSRIWLSEDCTIAFSQTAEIAAWDVVNDTVLAVFTPDISIQCMNIAVGGKMAVFGVSESPNLITLKLSTLDYTELAMQAQDAENVFGELRDPTEEDFYDDDTPGI